MTAFVGGLQPVCIHIPGFFWRLDFWATLLDLFGLAVLLSHDVEVLKFLEMFARKVPPLSRLEAIEYRIQGGVKRFEYASPAIQQEMYLDTFEREDKAIVLGLFTITKEAQIPDAVDLCACYVGVGHTLEIWMWLANKGQFNPLLTSISTDTVLAGRIEKKRQNFIYTVGFTLMAISSTFLLISIVINNL